MCAYRSTYPFRKITGAIFCGGRSTRMGSPKAGIRLPNGLTMVEHVYHALFPVCPNIVLVGHGDGVPAYLLEKLPLIRDRAPFMGPLAGLEALLRSGRDTEYLITPCDLPRVTPELYQLLIEAKEVPAVLATATKVQPLIGIFSRAELSRVQDQLFHRRLKMMDLLSYFPYQTVAVPESLHETLINANTSADLELV